MSLCIPQIPNTPANFKPLIPTLAQNALHVLQTKAQTSQAWLCLLHSVSHNQGSNDHWVTILKWACVFTKKLVEKTGNTTNQVFLTAAEGACTMYLANLINTVAQVRNLADQNQLNTAATMLPQIQEIAVESNNAFVADLGALTILGGNTVVAQPTIPGLAAIAVSPSVVNPADRQAAMALGACVDPHSEMFDPFLAKEQAQAKAQQQAAPVKQQTAAVQPAEQKGMRKLTLSKKILSDQDRDNTKVSFGGEEFLTSKENHQGYTKGVYRLRGVPIEDVDAGVTTSAFYNPDCPVLEGYTPSPAEYVRSMHMSQNHRGVGVYRQLVCHRRSFVSRFNAQDIIREVLIKGDLEDAVAAMRKMAKSLHLVSEPAREEKLSALFWIDNILLDAINTRLSVYDMEVGLNEVKLHGVHSGYSDLLAWLYKDKAKHAENIQHRLEELYDGIRLEREVENEEEEVVNELNVVEASTEPVSTNDKDADQPIDVVDDSEPCLVSVETHHLYTSVNLTHRALGYEADRLWRLVEKDTMPCLFELMANSRDYLDSAKGIFGQHIVTSDMRIYEYVKGICTDHWFVRDVT